MVTEAKKINKTVYVVDSHIAINDRVAKLVELRDSFDKMILIKAGRQRIKDQVIGIRPLLNPVTILNKLKLYRVNKLLDKYILFPSVKIFYVRAVHKYLVKRIGRELRDKKRVCLLTCLPAHDLVILGLALKKKFPQLEWIIDWQDLWSYDENYFDRIPSYYKQRMLERELEALANCDLNITTNNEAKKVLVEHYGVSPDRIVSINHHFSSEDRNAIVANLEKTQKLDKPISMKLGFLGAFFKPPRVPGDKVLEAIEQLQREGMKIELHLYGDEEKSILKKDIKPKAKDVIFHGRFGHKESLMKIAKCDVLLLVLSDLPNCRAVMSIKLPHYLITSKPILAIVPNDSAVANIIRETGAGYVIPSDREYWGDEMRKVLKKLDYKKYALQRNENVIESYSWEKISQQWLQVLSR